jgi:hypothetical protein
VVGNKPGEVHLRALPIPSSLGPFQGTPLEGLGIIRPVELVEKVVLDHCVNDVIGQGLVDRYVVAGLANPPGPTFESSHNRPVTLDHAPISRSVRR